MAESERRREKVAKGEQGEGTRCDSVSVVVTLGRRKRPCDADAKESARPVDRVRLVDTLSLLRKKKKGVVLLVEKRTTPST